MQQILAYLHEGGKSFCRHTLNGQHILQLKMGNALIQVSKNPEKHRSHATRTRPVLDPSSTDL